VARESHASDHEVVVAKYLRNFVDNVRVQTANRRADGDDGGHTDDDPDQREKSPQFVGEDRLQGDLQGVGIKGEKCFHKTEIAAGVAWLYATHDGEVLRKTWSIH